MTDLTSASDQPLPPPPLPQHVPRERREPPSLPSLDYKQLVGVVVAAVLGQIGLRANVGALSTTLGVLLIVGVVLWPQLRTSRTATVFGAGAVVFAVWLPLRASAWLVALNVAAIAAFLAAAAATVSPLSLRLSTGTLGTITKRLLQARYFFLCALRRRGATAIGQDHSPGATPARCSDRSVTRCDFDCTAGFG